MKIFRDFFKHKYIRVITFNSDKTSNIDYYKRTNINGNQLMVGDKLIMINPNHVFNAKGYSTILINDKASETINPLDFKSQYNHDDFQTAINSKITREIFTSLKTDKFDLVKILLIANALGILLIIYYIVFGGGISWKG